ncbi:hypothetical protein ACLBYG_22235 [Methylobacterium sp. D53M]
MPCQTPQAQTCTRFLLSLLVIAFALGFVSVAYHEALPTHFA